MTKIIELIITEDRRGLGKSDDDPVRLVTQLWTKEGKLIAETGDNETHSWFTSPQLNKEL
jgi:hypothetical protein